ncbi:50S ribosomal protein L25 [Clostridium sp. C2-6-12]|uniref:50S ribosomal protein L25 n=1 Tax=Clostridium sp. C2-6-12 TaxID=2698832 RepID=UPI001369CBC2|nr:50S ribosomal protein L25 [Clostridium sp. C2-6-12]
MEELNLNKRINTVGHNARQERKFGKIPGVIYGEKIGNELFYVDSLALSKELSVSGEHGVLTFNFEGKKKGTAVIKEVQKNSLGNKVIHIDLEEVAANAKMHTELLIKVTGKGVLESKGLIFQTQRELIKVVCTAENLPKDVELDISNGEAGRVYTFKDLNLGQEVSVMEDLSTVIGSISEDKKEDDSETEEIK